MDTFRAIGIDQALANTGVVVLEARRTAQFETIPCIHRDVIRTDPKKTSYQRAFKVLARVHQLLQDYAPEGVMGRVGMEGYSYGTGNGAHVAGEVGFAVKDACWRAHHDPLIIPPSLVKKYATGKGNAGKDIILKEVYRKWQFDCDSEHLADAYVIARICLALAGFGGKPLAYESEVLEKLKKGNDNA